MRQFQRITRLSAIIVALALVSSACGPKTPPQLSPGGAVAYHAHRVLQAVEVIQGVAMEGERQGVIPTTDAAVAPALQRRRMMFIEASPDLGWLAGDALAVDHETDGQTMKSAPLEAVNRHCPVRERAILDRGRLRPGETVAGQVRIGGTIEGAVNGL